MSVQRGAQTTYNLDVHAGVEQIMRLSGLEPLNYVPSPTNMRDTFLYIGERCNVAGSTLYKKAIVDGSYDKAAAIALKQVGHCPAN
jgi:5-methyltetrahydrofolate--homocysteine methyltransferase